MEPISESCSTELAITDVTEIKPENYINFWRNITSEQYNFGEEHVKIAGILASIFVSQDKFDLFETFLQEIDSEKMVLFKQNEQFVKAFIQLKMRRNSFKDVFDLLEVRIH